LITNTKLTKALKRRQFGVSEAQQSTKGSIVEAFECLVCQKVAVSAKLAAAGFDHEDNGGLYQKKLSLMDKHQRCPVPPGASVQRLLRSKEPNSVAASTKTSTYVNGIDWTREYWNAAARASWLAENAAANRLPILAAELDSFLNDAKLKKLLDSATEYDISNLEIQLREIAQEKLKLL